MYLFGVRMTLQLRSARENINTYNYSAYGVPNGVNIADAVDVITDFNQSVDKLDLRGLLVKCIQAALIPVI